jgi:hypothetical protein
MSSALDELAAIAPSEPPPVLSPHAGARESTTHSARDDEMGGAAAKPRLAPSAAAWHGLSPRSDKAHERRPATPRGDGPPIDAADLPPPEPGN